MAHRFSVVTGASRGIGAEYARGLGARGHDLLLVAREESRLTEVAREISQTHQVKVEIEVLDLSLPDAAQRLHMATTQRCQEIDILINNAGFGVYGAFSETPLSLILKMIQLHICTQIETIRLFLPGMIERQSGSIINVASIAGLLPIPFFAEYAATKAFIVSFSEALAEEVRPFGIHIQACCPGQTHTDFHATAGFQPKNPLGMHTPQDVVLQSLGKLCNNQTIVTIGWKDAISAFLSRWIPRGLLLHQVGKRTNPK
jgi:short-subunit dehydrogenase